MERLPSIEELHNAISKLKNENRTAAESGILPEMIKSAGSQQEFLSRLLELIHDVWRVDSVPNDWHDATLIPIPKKGNLNSCDNWCGICLLDTVGKFVATILQERLQKLAEDELPGSQCGGRDMKFVVR